MQVPRGRAFHNSEFTICHGYWFFCWTSRFTRRVLLYIFVGWTVKSWCIVFLNTEDLLLLFCTVPCKFKARCTKADNSLTTDNWLEHWIGCVSGPNMMWLAVVARPCVVKYEDFPTLVTTTRLSLNLRSQQLDWAPSESAFGHDDSGSCPGVGGNIDWSDAHVWIWLFNTWTDTTQTYWQGLAPGGHGPLHSGPL